MLTPFLFQYKLNTGPRLVHQVYRPFSFFSRFYSPETLLQATAKGSGRRFDIMG
ncbi:MAG TPA: hypothetical protein VIM79_17225 [Niastella sp.]